MAVLNTSPNVLYRDFGVFFSTAKISWCFLRKRVKWWRLSGMKFERHFGKCLLTGICFLFALRFVESQIVSKVKTLVA